MFFHIRVVLFQKNMMHVLQMQSYQCTQIFICRLRCRVLRCGDLIGFSKLHSCGVKLSFEAVQHDCLETIAQASRVLSLHELKHGTWIILFASQAIGGNASIITCWFHVCVYIYVLLYSISICITLYPWSNPQGMEDREDSDWIQSIQIHDELSRMPDA